MVFKERMEISLTYGSQFYNSRESIAISRHHGADFYAGFPDFMNA